MTQFTASRIRRLDGGLLLVFRALVRHRSGTAAAADLNLSQSAVSHALARLRDVFDDPLFRRLPHGLEPTARALGLLPEVEEVLQRLEDLTDSAPAFESETSTRRFAVSTSEFVTALLGADLTQRFAEQAPHASLGIAHLARDHLAGALRRGEVDLAIGRLEELSGTEFVLSELFVDEYCVVARAGHPQIRKRIGPRQYNDAAHVFAHSSS